jgi:hypothetical protein
VTLYPGFIWRILFTFDTLRLFMEAEFLSVWHSFVRLAQFCPSGIGLQLSFYFS